MPNINGVEVFSAGTWNGDEYTLNDLNEMVLNFYETKEAVRPYLKLGHDNEQKFLQKEGIPAAGWIDRLYVQGEKLLADFIDIPQKIYELIDKKAYRKVSSEIFWNLRIKDKVYRRLLSGVALLGAETPGVMNLSDILSMYGLDTEQIDAILKRYDINMEGEMPNEKLEKELQEVQEKLVQAEEQTKTFQSEIETLKKENDILVAYKKDVDAEKEKLAAEKEETERKNFIMELEKENLCCESMKPLLHSLLSAEKKEYCISEKTYSKAGLIKEALKLFKATQNVNLEESSIEGEKSDSDPVEEKIEKYQAEHKCSYKDAFKAVMRKPETSEE